MWSTPMPSSSSSTLAFAQPSATCWCHEASCGVELRSTRLVEFVAHIKCYGLAPATPEERRFAQFFAMQAYKAATSSMHQLESLLAIPSFISGRSTKVRKWRRMEKGPTGHKARVMETKHDQTSPPAALKLVDGIDITTTRWSRWWKHMIK